MGVLNWMQTKLHGSHRSRRRPAEFSASTARPADASGGVPQTENNLDDGWTTAMLSIGTFGMGEGNTTKSCGHLDELSRLQEELKSLATANELGRVNHLQLERLLSSSSTSRTLATRAFGGFGPRPSLRETVPEMRFDEIVWGLLLKKAHPENPAFSDTAARDDQVVRMAPKGKVQADDKGGKWIRTDSQYIVLEI
ncbi:uncharacterized protein [Zea mays]|uniref:uncharacterized protein n=1 Tax=Zea mays TaxID=4577 RepID=UPI0009AA775C|nr:uncharacterized protein LOC103631791 [Zea mays]|eukprot:XP_008651539.2 uncharacterized protein LOC103631791 [Zea mays]